MPDEVFRFACSPGVACFNACCRDLNQSLYPYDILRLKKRLKLPSGEFLERYTARQWIEGQEIETYNSINDKLMQIIRLKNQVLPGPLDLKSRHLVYLALYDLDNFRNQIFKNKLPENFEVHPQKLNPAKADDTELLEIGMEWIKQVVFKEQAA